MGDKSPKTKNKQAAQKQAKDNAAAKQKNDNKAAKQVVKPKRSEPQSVVCLASTYSAQIDPSGATETVGQLKVASVES